MEGGETNVHVCFELNTMEEPHVPPFATTEPALRCQSVLRDHTHTVVLGSPPLPPADELPSPLLSNNKGRRQLVPQIE
jgi:hypothetical protein